MSIAANEVEGVACIGPSTTSGLRSVFGSKPSTQGIDITVDEEDKLHISIRVDVYYGYVLPDLAANIRQAISDAVTSQVAVSYTHLVPGPRCRAQDVRGAPAPVR